MDLRKVICSSQICLIFLLSSSEAVSESHFLDAGCTSFSVIKPMEFGFMSNKYSNERLRTDHRLAGAMVAYLGPNQAVIGSNPM